jgi:acetyltransferase-like isoleucine patch superfamily enzyme
MFSVLTQIWRRIIGILLRRIFGGSTAARFQGVRVGKGCRLLCGHFGSEPWLITIGDRVTITSGVRLLTHDGSSWLFRDKEARRFRYAGIKIGSDVFIGTGSIILPGVHIGDRVVIGAGTVVTKSIPSGFVVCGNPARVIGTYENLDKKAKRLWKTDSDMRGRTFRERVESIAEKEPRIALRAD